MKTVRDILKVKGHDVWSIEVGSTVFEALGRMAGTRLAGIISERDYARKIILLGRTSPNTLVEEIMTSHVAYTHLDQSIEECMAIMTDKRIRHLPVFDEGKLVGIISIGDLVKSIIADQQFIIEQLERYITS
jgi:CBS domain-containing protein